MRQLAAILAASFLTACSVHSNDDASNVKRVYYDEGGNIEDRRTEIERLNANGTRVEILGPCASACTMYLGSNDVAVHPNVKFSFHGSTQGGIAPLSQDIKAAPDAVMALMYPPNLRTWYWETGRHMIFAGHEKTGAELKAMDPDHINLIGKTP